MRGGKYPCTGAVVFGCNVELEHRVDYTIFGMRESKPRTTRLLRQTLDKGEVYSVSRVLSTKPLINL
jgi:hypothetical protein